MNEKEKRRKKRSDLLKKHSVIDSWRTGERTNYHNHYIIDEDGKLWHLTQSFTNCSDIGEYFYGETLKVVEKTKWYNFLLPRYKVIEEPFLEDTDSFSDSFALI